MPVFGEDVQFLLRRLVRRDGTGAQLQHAVEALVHHNQRLFQLLQCDAAAKARCPSRRIRGDAPDFAELFLQCRLTGQRNRRRRMTLRTTAIIVVAPPGRGVAVRINAASGSASYARGRH